jgi:hypothetical protein
MGIGMGMGGWAVSVGRDGVRLSSCHRASELDLWWALSPLSLSYRATTANPLRLLRVYSNSILGVLAHVHLGKARLDRAEVIDERRFEGGLLAAVRRGHHHIGLRAALLRVVDLLVMQ